MASEGGRTSAYQAYQVFSADIDARGEATHLAWPSAEVRDAVLGILSAQGYEAWLEDAHPGEGQRERAQNAASFVGWTVEEAGAGAAAPGAAGPSWELLVGLARALHDGGQVEPLTLSAGETLHVPTGYWLVCPGPKAASDATSSAPIWLAVGEQEVTIFEKASAPTLEKQVLDPDDNVWTQALTVGRSDPVTFRLVATLPENLAAYDHYRLCIADRLPTGCGLVLRASQTARDVVRVLVGDKEVPVDDARWNVSLDGRNLLISCEDLADPWWGEHGVAAGAKICVTYPAQLNDKATSSASGNVNAASLTCTNDPVSLSVGTTGEVSACLHTQTLTLRKQDAQSGAPLKGAAFTVRRRGDKTSAGASYLQADGSYAKAAHQFVTGGDGTVRIRGVGAGTYEIVERQAPQGYRATSEPIVLTIDAAIDEHTSRRSELKATATADQAHVALVDAETGEVEVVVSNESAPVPPAQTPLERLAQTGVGPIASLLAVLGIAMIAASRLTGRHR